MSLTPDHPSSEAEANALYARLLAQDPTAPADIALAFLNPLVTWLSTVYPELDEHFYQTAAEDALLALIKRPTTYKPQRQTLNVYLRLSARGDLLNLQRSERRHRARQIPLEVVERLDIAGKHGWAAEADPAEIVVRDDEATTHPQLPSPPTSVSSRLSDGEAKAFELLQQGVRKTEAYARELGLDHLPKAQQQREVKRVKDRLKKRVERAEENHE